MPDRKKNQKSNKRPEEESQTGDPNPTQKLPDDSPNNPSKSINTQDDTANERYSQTRKHDEEMNKDKSGGKGD